MSETFYSIPANVSGRMPHPNGTHHVVSLSMHEGDHAGNASLHLPVDHEALQHLALGKAVMVHLAHHTPAERMPAEPVEPRMPAEPIQPAGQVHSLSGHATPASGLFNHSANYAERPTAVYPVVSEDTFPGEEFLVGE
jgi:hypothetical protein